MNNQGIFIALEGGEGGGKSTQVGLLKQTLTDAGHDVVCTREPGGTKVGAEIRRLVLDPEVGRIDPRAEALLFAADRAHHVATLIRPALAQGSVVITDRFMDSSAAYQGAGRDLPRQEILDLSMWATHGLVPDLTIVLDLPHEQGLRRVRTDEFGQADKIESEARASFFADVRQGFLDLANADPSRYSIIDASQPVHTVAEAVWARVQLLLDDRS